MAARKFITHVHRIFIDALMIREYVLKNAAGGYGRAFGDLGPRSQGRAKAWIRAI
jgi:hypothetical protein